MPKNENFRETWERQPHLVGGNLLNRQARALNGLDLARERAWAEQAARFPSNALLGLAVITSSDDSCAADPRNPGATVPPCRTEHLYLARLRWYDYQTQEWKEYEQDFRLDASHNWELEQTEATWRPVTGIGYGPIPRFRKGDVVPAYWDEQRGALIPLVGPPHRPRRQVFSRSVLSPLPADPQGTEELRYALLELQLKPDVSDPFYGVGTLYWTLPRLVSSEHDWAQTLSGEWLVQVRDHSELQLRFWNPGRYWSLALRELWVRVEAVGSPQDDLAYSTPAISSAVGEAVPLAENAGYEGEERWYDEPRLVVSGNTLTVRMNDPLDRHLCRVQVQATLEPAGVGELSYRPNIEFELTSALTLGSSSAFAQITDQWGPGEDRSTSSQIVVLNMMNGAFHGPIGTLGLATFYAHPNIYAIHQLRC